MRRYPGPNYRRVLEWIHALVKPDVYLEIGVDTGLSLTLAQPPTRCIAIDPDPHLPDAGLPATLELFRMTSDEFFDSHLPPGLRVRLAFLDGLHLFEQVLRDLMNLERCLDGRSIVLLHDCVPLSELTADRNHQTGFWTGDVWKLVPCLKQFRPDLNLAVVQTPPTGLGIITGFARRRSDADASYHDMVEAFIKVPFAYFEEHGSHYCDYIKNDIESVRRYLYLEFPDLVDASAGCFR